MNDRQTKAFRVNLHGVVDHAGLQSTQAEVESPDLLKTAPFGGRFEDLISALDAEPRIHAELDGSFVFRDESSGIQVDGMIYDLKGQIQYVELLGTCDWSAWRWLIDLLHCQRPLAYTLQDLSTGQVLSATEFESLFAVC